MEGYGYTSSQDSWFGVELEHFTQGGHTGDPEDESWGTQGDGSWVEEFSADKVKGRPKGWETLKLWFKVSGTAQLGLTIVTGFGCGFYYKFFFSYGSSLFCCKFGWGLVVLFGGGSRTLEWDAILHAVNGLNRLLTIFL